MVIPVLYTFAGVVLLFVGGEGLLRGSVALARRLGISSLLVGMTVVAAGTSAPELVVSVDAALTGRSGIALGNVVGSNICNILLILGLSSLIGPLAVAGQVVRQEVPVMIGASLLVVGMAWGGIIGRIEGIVLVTLLVGYVIFLIRQSRRASPRVRSA